MQKMTIHVISLVVGLVAGYLYCMVIRSGGWLALMGFGLILVMIGLNILVIMVLLKIANMLKTNSIEKKLLQVVMEEANEMKRMGRLN